MIEPPILRRGLVVAFVLPDECENAGQVRRATITDVAIRGDKSRQGLFVSPLEDGDLTPAYRVRVRNGVEIAAPQSDDLTPGTWHYSPRR